MTEWIEVQRAENDAERQRLADERAELGEEARRLQVSYYMSMTERQRELERGRDRNKQRHRDKETQRHRDEASTGTEKRKHDVYPSASSFAVLCQRVTHVLIRRSSA